MPPPPGIDDPALVEELQGGAADDELSVIVRLFDPHALPKGVRIVTRFGDVATVRVARAKLQELAESPGITALEASRNLRPSYETDEDWPDDDAEDEEDTTPSDPAEQSLNTRRPEGVQGKGRGCLVAALDWGIDPAHPAFQHSSGSSRIASLWDQRGIEGSGPGNRWGYGRIFTSADIDRALQSDDPYRSLNYNPADAGGVAGAHGTHVLDIAAGSGLGGGMPGVAPEADLIFCHLARTTDVLGEGNLGDSASVLEALDHVFTVAGDRPCVVNMSVGAHGGPHDGSTLVELGIDQAVSLAPGRAVVNSAGNYRTKRAHAMGRVPPNGVKTIRFRVPPHDTNDSEVEVFYQHIDRFTVEVLGPSGALFARVSQGQDLAMIASGEVVGHVYHRVRHGTSGDHHVDVLLKADAPGGVWSLRLIGDSVHDGRYHAWIERDRGLQPTFVKADVVTSSTTGTICNGRLSITSGCVDARHPLMLVTFSSGGPTRDGRVKPELVAPGYRIRAARSTPPGQSPAARYTVKSGTSMAAPHVAGTIALMFEAAGTRLEIYDTRALLFGSVDPSPFFGRSELGPDLHRFGYGNLDIVAAERAARVFGRENEVRNVKEGDAVASPEADGLPDDTQPEFAAPVASEEEAGSVASEASGESPPWDMGEGGDMTEPVPRSEILRDALRATQWISDPAELQRLAFQSLGIDPGQPLVPLSNPGGPLLTPVRPGDLLVRSAPVAGGRYNSIILSEEAEPWWSLAGRGVPLESTGPGLFVQVVELAPGGGPPLTIGRRLTQECGWVPRYQTVLRPELLPESGADTWADGTGPDAGLEEGIGVDDVAIEMHGLRCRFLQPFTAHRSDGTARTFAQDAVLFIEDWHGTGAEATIDGFPVPKLLITPLSVRVTGIRPYNVPLSAQRTAVERAARQLSDWIAQEPSYRRNHSVWETEKARLEGVVARKGVIYSQLWVRQMMYNRFDPDFDRWTRHYNTALHPATDLDPAVVKSMAYQESRMGASGAHLMPPPSDWSSGDRHPVRSRFNILQAVDSFGPQQWLMMKEMAPTIFTRHGLDALEAGAVWLGMSSSQYGSHPTFMTALREFFEHRSGGNNLMGTTGRDLHEDYGFWIRTGIRWLFEKYVRLPRPTWSEAVRAYNGSGTRARRYRDQVLARVGTTDPFVAEAEVPDQTEVAVCTPAKVPDPERKGIHPRIFGGPTRRHSRNSSVGQAQELLNRFLAGVTTPGGCLDTSAATTTFITSSLTTLSGWGQNPLVVDCDFGKGTELAAKMFQACAGITRDGVIGWNTWALLELFGTHPAPGFTPRPCCILAPDAPVIGNNLLDPTALGTHGAASEVNGLVYCGKAGFVDLGHARDMIDLTKFLHDQLTTAGGPPQALRTLLGIVSIRRTPADPLETAAAIAFDDAMGHEIVSWDTFAPGGRNSSFSPEDLVSNFLGTLVGRRAITRMAASGGTFAAAATKELDDLLTSLDVQTEAESENAFNKINLRWVDFTGAASLLSDRYLLRRNFTRIPFNAGHPSDAATPAFVTDPFSATARADFDYFHLEGGKVLPGWKFATATTRVRQEARTEFGADFNKP